MRPSSTRRSTPSSATVSPKALRRPRASRIAIPLPALSRPVGRGSRGGTLLEELARGQAEALDHRVDPRPLLRQESAAFSLEETGSRASLDEHAASSLRLDEIFVNQLL